MIREQLELPITGMTCASCSARVEKALRKQPGVLSATVNLADERATIDFLPLVMTQPLLIAAVEKAGYGVIITENSADANDSEADARALELNQRWQRLLVAMVFAVPLFIISMAKDFGFIAPWPIGSAVAMVATATSSARTCACAKAATSSARARCGTFGHKGG